MVSYFAGPNCSCIPAITLDSSNESPSRFGQQSRLYAEHFRAPTLSQGDIVILENLPAHKLEHARKIIEPAGTTLLLPPPYAPDFNPIQQAFAKIKAHLRKTAARPVDALETAVATALKAFTPDACANSFASASHKPK